MLALGLAVAGPAQALQCVPYAREESGIDLRGDAWRWWTAAQGIYERGQAPKLGAVIVFRKHGKMRLGHVAVVSRIVDKRHIMIDHANWGSRDGGRGEIMRMVAVEDVSPHNDWTAVKVWARATGDFGNQTYPTYGFIYQRAGHGHKRNFAGANIYVANLSVLAEPLEPAPRPAVDVETLSDAAPAAGIAAPVWATSILPALQPTLEVETDQDWTPGDHTWKPVRH